MKEIRILGIAINNRMQSSIDVQDILTKFGCSIKTRLGLHEVTDEKCSVNGLIILELTGDSTEWEKIESELLKIDGVRVQKMKFPIV